MKRLRTLLCHLNHRRNRFGLILTMAPTDPSELKAYKAKKTEGTLDIVAGFVGPFIFGAAALGVYQVLSVFAFTPDSILAFSLPALSWASFWGILGVAGAIIGSIISFPDILTRIRSVYLPDFLETTLSTARKFAKSISLSAKNPAIKDDQEALSLAKEALMLYDNLLLDLESASQVDPAGFRATFFNISNNKGVGDVDETYYLWLKETLDAIDTLLAIDSNLKQVVANRIDEQALKARRRTLEDVQKKRVTTSRPRIEESLGNIKLREDIRKKSSLELAQFVETLEDKEALHS